MIEQLYLAAVKVPTGSTGIPVLEAENVFAAGLNLVYYVAGVICVISIIAAGILYAVANGEAEKIKAAKNTILYAVIGLVVIMMAFTITGFVVGRF